MFLVYSGIGGSVVVVEVVVVLVVCPVEVDDISETAVVVFDFPSFIFPAIAGPVKANVTDKRQVMLRTSNIIFFVRSSISSPSSGKSLYYWVTKRCAKFYSVCKFVYA